MFGSVFWQGFIKEILGHNYVVVCLVLYFWEKPSATVCILSFFLTTPAHYKPPQILNMLKGRKILNFNFFIPSDPLATKSIKKMQNSEFFYFFSSDQLATINNKKMRISQFYFYFYSALRPSLVQKKIRKPEN